MTSQATNEGHNAPVSTGLPTSMDNLRITSPTQFHLNDSSKSVSRSGHQQKLPTQAGQSNTPTRRGLPTSKPYPMDLPLINETSLANAVDNSRAPTAKSRASRHQASSFSTDENSFPSLSSGGQRSDKDSAVGQNSKRQAPIKAKAPNPVHAQGSIGSANIQYAQNTLPTGSQQQISTAADQSKRKSIPKTKKKQFVDGQHLLNNSHSSISSGQRSNTQSHASVTPAVNQFARRPFPGSGAEQFSRSQNQQFSAPISTGFHNISRPATHGRQLYDPRNAHRAQLQYFETIVLKTIEDTEMGVEESNEKEKLRLHMEHLCRSTIATHETQSDPAFYSESVELVRFGSLATTFATKNSDMDLVLLSPDSKVDAGSIESPLPRLIEGALLGNSFGARLLTRTRVPIIKFCASPTPELLQCLIDARGKWEAEEKIAGLEAAPSTAHAEPDKPESPQKPSVTQSSTVDHDEPFSAMSPEATTTSTLESRLEPPVKRMEQNTGRSNKANSMADLGLEGDDESLHSKSDEDRVRLYRLAMKEGWYSGLDRQVISSFLMYHEAWSKDQSQDRLSDLDAARTRLANIPNVLQRYRDPTVRALEFPKSGVGVQCDINFSNRLGIYNSQLLRCYSKCDPRVRQMVLFVKAWAKKRRINSGYEGTLSSYGYVLLVLHFLLNIASPPVIPNLQLEFLSELPNQWHGHVEVDGHIVHFYRDEDVLSQLAAQHKLNQNHDSIGFLLAGFFNYYGSSAGNSSYHWMRDCISIRTRSGIIRKEEKGWVAAKTEHQAASNNETKEIRQRYLVALEDPFELTHNVGRTVSHDGICAIRDEFRRAHRLISSGGLGSEDLMEEVRERATLQHKYFGPNFIARGGYEKRAGPQNISKSTARNDNEKPRAPSQQQLTTQPRASLPLPTQPSNNSATSSFPSESSPSHHQQTAYPQAHPLDLPYHNPTYDMAPMVGPQDLQYRSPFFPQSNSPQNRPYFGYPPNNYPFPPEQYSSHPQVRLPPPPQNPTYTSPSPSHQNFSGRSGFSPQADGQNLEQPLPPTTNSREMSAQDVDPAIVSMGGRTGGRNPQGYLPRELREMRGGG